MSENINAINPKVKILESGKTKAIIKLDFGDHLVKGFRIQESKFPNKKGDKLWITPPSYKDGSGKYHPLFYMMPKDKWKELKKKIWDAYYKEKDNYYKKRMDIDAEDQL